MNRSVSEQSLLSLLPSLAGPLPPGLLNYTISILAQSRSKASSLKPEEEVARAYACAHLACERLKQQLNLPPIEPRPPVPARVYKKVYAYFNSAIPEKSAQFSSSAPLKSPAVKTRTPQKPPSAGVRTANGQPSKSAGTPRSSTASRTPTKPSVTSDQTPTKISSRKRVALQADPVSPEKNDEMQENRSDGDDDIVSADEGDLPVHKRRREIGSGKGINLRAGLGTMFVDNVDWLSEENRRDYAAWSKNIRRRIKHIEQAQSPSQA